MIVIPAQAGIQTGTGCRIKSGMTEFVPLIAGLISIKNSQYRPDLATIKPAA
jgi:hypothetical protein